MEWLSSLFLEHSALQAVVVLSLISAIGLGLGRVHFWGISLGVTFVFFAGILAGHFGLSVDPQMLNYAESFGLVIFVYSLGLQVGPGFFSSFRKGGVTLNIGGCSSGYFVNGGSQLCYRYIASRYGWYSLRSDDKHSGVGSGAADIETNGHG